MSMPSRDHPSVRVHAPPGGHSSNIFGTESEQSAANKKKNLGSDIFGTKQENVEPAPTKQNRNTGSNIFGNEPEETHARGGTIAGQYKQTQMKSNIFGSDEPTTSRQVSDKSKSNIFAAEEPNKRQQQVRQGLRVGYNPINGEAYTKPNETDLTTKKPEEENGNGQTKPVDTTETSTDTAKDQPTATATSSKETTNAQVEPTNNGAKPAEKHDDNSKGNDAQKGVHTSVRVFHPPGGKSNGPLW